MKASLLRIAGLVIAVCTRGYDEQAAEETLKALGALAVALA